MMAAALSAIAPEPVAKTMTPPRRTPWTYASAWASLAPNALRSRIKPTSKSVCGVLRTPLPAISLGSPRTRKSFRGKPLASSSRTTSSTEFVFSNKPTAVFAIVTSRTLPRFAHPRSKYCAEWNTSGNCWSGTMPERNSAGGGQRVSKLRTPFSSARNFTSGKTGPRTLSRLLFHSVYKTDQHATLKSDILTSDAEHRLEMRNQYGCESCYSRRLHSG